MLPESKYWVIMMNDMPLCVCSSQEQAVLELVRQRAVERLNAERTYGLDAREMIDQHLDRRYLHANVVPGSRIDHG